MGEPDSSQIDLVMQVALGALSPGGNISVKALKETGLHREVVRQCMAALGSEIKYLVGWKSLDLYDYLRVGYNSTQDTLQKAEKLTTKWYEALESQGLSFEKAVLIYDGEAEPVPAPDYRLFILRDGRLLCHDGGLHGLQRSGLVCGSALTVLDRLDEHYASPIYAVRANVEPFIILLRALDKALGTAIADRESKVNAQKKLQEDLQRVISQVSNK